MSQAKINHLRALGVEILSTRSDVGKGHPRILSGYGGQVGPRTGSLFYQPILKMPIILWPMRHGRDLKFGNKWTIGLMRWWWALVPVVPFSGLTHFFKSFASDRICIGRPRWLCFGRLHQSAQAELRCGLLAGRGYREDYIPKLADFALLPERLMPYQTRRALMRCVRC